MSMTNASMDAQTKPNAPVASVTGGVAENVDVAYGMPGQGLAQAPRAVKAADSNGSHFDTPNPGNELPGVVTPIAVQSNPRK